MSSEIIKFDDPIFSVWRENYLSGSAEHRYCIIQDFKREKQLKNWKRQWKIELITKNNPCFKNLSSDIGLTDVLTKTLIDPESSSG